MRIVVVVAVVAASACTTILGDDFEIVPGGAGGDGLVGQGGGGDAGGAGPGGSGGGSSNCGDGIVEGAELCDDANTDASDGCVDCSTEWTCAMPGQIFLMQEGAVLTGSIDGSTLDGDDHLGAATCGGSSAGAATDRVLSFTLDAQLDVFVTLDSTFDGLVRATTAVCDLAGSIGCVNDRVGAGSEFLHLPQLDAGTYFLLVDGAAASDAGDFSVDLTACSSNPGDVAFHELHIGQSDYVTLQNNGSCPVQLEGMQIFFDDRDDLQSGLEDCTTELPSYLLMPGASVRVHEDPLVGDIAALPGVTSCASGVPFNPGRGSTAYLCDGVCVQATVLDMVSFNGNLTSAIGNPPTPIAGLTFNNVLPSITTAAQDDRRWYRTGVTGQNPTWTGADWAVETRVVAETFESGFTNWTPVTGQAATIEIAVESAVGVGSLSLEQTGGNGLSDGLALTGNRSPRHISFYTRVSALDVNAGYLELRSGGLPTLLWSIEPTGMGLERDNNTRTEQPFMADTWYHIELRNIDWVARTADLYIDSVLIALAVANYANFTSFDEMRLYSASNTSKVWWDHIEMWD